MNDGISAAEFYGLNEIPFEPTGAAATKYPYVAPRKFDVVEQRVNESFREKKLYVILFRAPQGGGKTATAAELKRRVEAQQYAGGKAVLVLNNLADLNFAHYASDFINAASSYLPDFNFARYKGRSSPGELKNALVSILKALATKHKLVVWVIDEFDILVDYPKLEQSQFLQILREIVDELANESFPILFIMSHTMKSSREFEKHLRSVHGPFQSRIVASLEIGYTFPETKAIIAARLRSARKTEQAYNSIEPFSEDALHGLFDLIVSAGGSGELNDFRFFERCCYFSVLKGAEGKFPKIDRGIIEQTFQQGYKSWEGKESSDRVSLFVRSARTSILAGSQISRNEAILDGLHKGMQLITDQFDNIPSARTVYGQKVDNDVHVSAMQLELNHKPSGKTIVADWIIGAREGGILFQEDLRKLDLVTPGVISKLEKFSNVTLFSYVSDMNLDISGFTSCDEVIPINSDTARDLIGLGVKDCTAEDTNELRKSFDSDVAQAIRKIFTDKVRDITKEPTDPVFRLATTLAIAHTAGVELTREALKEEEKKLFGGTSRLGDRHLSDLLELGFAREDGPHLIPTIPKSVDHLMTSLKTGPRGIKDLGAEFGSNAHAVIWAASKLGLVEVDSDEDQVVKKQETTVNKDLDREVTAVRSLIHKDGPQTFAAEQAKLILRALGQTGSEGEYISNVVRTASLKMLPALRNALTETNEVGGQPVGGSDLGTKTPRSIEPARPQPESPKASSSHIEDLVLKLLTGPPMTLEDLVRKLGENGATGEFRGPILGMVVKNKLKLTK